METKHNNRGNGRFSRRRFLGTVGVGALSSAAAGAAGVPAAHAEHVPGSVDSGHFGRMFRLPPFAEPTPQVRAALLELGKPGGILDARDQLEKGPEALILDPGNNPDNPNNTAGTTFMGQFIDHDMTFDVGSRLGTPTEPRSATNGRTPGFDLDSVYGGGPVVSPQLYDPTDHIKLKVESGGLFEDLPRTSDNTALLGDPRNDEHVIIAGLHAAFLLFHNRAVDFLRSQGPSNPDTVFAGARRLTSWHYQWLVLHEFLPLFVGKDMVDDILSKGRQFYKPRSGEGFIPVEFQGAAYRFGHSLVRPSYRANLTGNNGQPFFGFIFDPKEEGKADPGDLRGGARAPRRFVDWQTFFDFGDQQVRPNKQIDTKISTPLFNLPLGAIASHDPPTSLAQRTLLRHLTWLLPSGQRIAREMKAHVLSSEDLAELRPFGQGFEQSTPLWYYVLKEAEVMERGLRLGPVGGRIVGEVFIGLLQTDPSSYLSVNPGWRPTLPARDGGTGNFRMVDFLTFAGVDPTSRSAGSP